MSLLRRSNGSTRDIRLNDSPAVLSLPGEKGGYYNLLIGVTSVICPLCCSRFRNIQHAEPLKNHFEDSCLRIRQKIAENGGMWAIWDKRQRFRKAVVRTADIGETSMVESAFEDEDRNRGI